MVWNLCQNLTLKQLSLMQNNREILTKCKSDKTILPWPCTYTDPEKLQQETFCCFDFLCFLSELSTLVFKNIDKFFLQNAKSSTSKSCRFFKEFLWDFINNLFSFKSKKMKSDSNLFRQGIRISNLKIYYAKVAFSLRKRYLLKQIVITVFSAQKDKIW